MSFRYYTEGWVGEAQYHPVHVASPICFNGSKVKPTMRLTEKPYEVWVAKKKDKDDQCGGEVMIGYCTCPAGKFFRTRCISQTLTGAMKAER